MNPRPPLPPFTEETARQKVQAAEDAWNTLDPERVAQAYTPDSQWRVVRRARRDHRVPQAQVGRARARLRPAQGPLGVPQSSSRSCSAQTKRFADSSVQLAGDGQAGAVAAQTLRGLRVVVVVGQGGPAGALGGLEPRPAHRRRALVRAAAGSAARVGL